MFSKIMKYNMTLLPLLSMFVIACSVYERARPIEVKRPVKPIRIGVAPQSPPYAFKEDNKTVGIEADFAKELANKIGRPMQFVEMPFKRLIPALLDNKIDIIMSGMSITKSRKLSVSFTRPYMTNGIMTLMRTSDSQIYTSPEKIYNTTRIIGVVKGTTADVFARRKCPKATVGTYIRREDAVRALKQQQISLYISDGPIIAWLFAQNDTEFSALFVPMTEEYTAWAIRPGNDDLIIKLDEILDEWEKDGTIRRILKRWLPYM
ncbi:transporter substrate-binding domain-containing protein [bacterium]|nr:transporter substrate-binding domain-containing protein [bacterium]